MEADVVALDQLYVYNRYGSYNPFGMMYALRHDVVALEGPTPGPGNARLRDGKRPRPLVLRANEGDCLKIRFENWLSPTPRRAAAEGNPAFRVARGLDDAHGGHGGHGAQSDTPVTREASIHVNGLQYLNMGADGAHVGRNESSLVAPGEQASYMLYAEKEGTFLMYSMGALTGGQGLGTTTSLGLFGAVTVQPKGSRWYRSQVTHAQLQAAIKRDAQGQKIENPDGTPQIDYEVEVDGQPVLAMLDGNNRLVHSDLTAIIAGYTPRQAIPTDHDDGAFREFTIIFHDEVKAVQAFAELDDHESFKGIADHGGINYGIAGAGAMILANRAKVGPNKDCPNCKFEEFFMASWPNGDPALNVVKDGEGNAVEALWPDDPSNVYRSYLRDPVRFRNLHAGPRETHVFHLHGQQWLRTPGNPRSAYTDSQTIGPGEAYTYEIAYGGSGNRNLSPGDSIFHCHLYPHFAGGMWSLWRHHDVFEDGSPVRNLPDAEIAQGTPNPALVPLPTRGMAPLPTYEPTTLTVADQSLTRPAMPGYPFYIAGIAGRRAPLPPLDLVVNGGMGRHVVTSAPADGILYGERGQFDVMMHKLNIKLLPEQGTPVEQDAMAYHEGAFPGATAATTPYGFPARAYEAYRPDGAPERWFVNGQPRRMGAPFANPCPPGTPVRTYHVAHVETTIVANNAGWHDPQGRIYVLEKDIAATLDGSRRPEPLVMRANSGECIELQLTNLMPDALVEDDFQLFTPSDMAGLHPHLVKFDMGSDGGMNGFNYEDGVHSPHEVHMMIEAINRMGGAFVADGTLAEGGERVQLQAAHHPRIHHPLAHGAQTTQQVLWADPLLDAQGQDRTLGMAFFHDHMSAASWQQHGMYGAFIIEPAGSTWRDPESGVRFGTRSDGGPTSYRADILTAKPADSFREFALMFADFGLLYDADGKPINPPTQKELDLPFVVGHRDERAPEAISASDPGTMLINYRNEPIPLRIGELGADRFVQKPGAAGDMSNAFRSDLHGDPATPLLRGYRGDKIVMRLLQGAHEEQHIFGISGHRWLREPSDPDSGYVAAAQIGLSENFTIDLSQLDDTTGAMADYMYSSLATDDLWNGMWGIMRSYNVLQPDLLALPNNARPHQGPRTVSACPPGAPLRHFTVHAITARGNLPGDRLVYHDGLYDPDAILFVEGSRLADLRAGLRDPEPLILRAAAGDCIQIRLQNELPEEMPSSLHFNFNPPIVKHFNTNQVRTSNHVSLQPQLLSYNPQQGDGANIGFNKLQSVPPGESSVFRWYAGVWRRQGNQLITTPVEFGAINLRSMADVVNHAAHGAIGALIVEPAAASWVSDPGSDAQATVIYTDTTGVRRSFREFVMVVQDEIALHSDNSLFAGGDPLQPTALRNLTEVDDSEESGHKGFNYRSEPLWARLQMPPEADEDDLNETEQADLLSSAAGEPQTPVFRARAGESMRLRVLLPSGHARQHALTLHGALWPVNSFQSGTNSTVIGPNEQTFYAGNLGGLAAGSAWNIVPLNGAGGAFQVPGDYLLRGQSSIHFYGGIWGIVRVSPNEEAAP
ncbi:MAG: copper oxidase [Bradymonadaceae bacterium]|nr:copper oxidase [Lujinxingiaceae bacterium]